MIGNISYLGNANVWMSWSATVFNVWYVTFARASFCDA